MTTPRFNHRRLSSAMHAKGYTAGDLAYEIRQASGGRLKTTERQVYKWVKGDHQPSGEAVVVAARALEITVEWLYETDGEDDEEAALLRDLEQLPADLRLRVERLIRRAKAGAR